MKGQKGITLVALIITIIVLLILAVVTISAVSNDGVIDHANNAAQTYQNNKDIENNTIEDYVDYLDNKVSEIE